MEVNKTWAGNTTNWPDDVANVRVKLQQSVNGGDPTDVDPAQYATISPDNWKLTQATINAMFETSEEEKQAKAEAQAELEKRFFRELPKYDNQGRQITYSVVENTVTPVEGKTVSLNDFTISYTPNNGRNEESTITIDNVRKPGSVQVTKTFSGVDALPENFQITAEWGPEGSKQSIHLNILSTGNGYDETSLPTDVTVSRTNTNAEGETPASYAWTISGLPVGTEVTFTEENYNVPGYVVSSIVSVNGAPATPGTSGIATTSASATLPDSAKVAFNNTYTPGVELPATGGTGNTVYTLAGLTLLLGASLILYYRRRREQN